MPVHNYSDKRATRFQKGASLMEAMLVLCLLSILIALSGGTLQSLWIKYDLRLAAKEVKGRLEFARMKAILERADYEVKIYGQSILYRRAASEEDWKRHKLKENIVYYPQNTVVCKFYDNGLARGGTITIEAKGEEHCEEVVVNSGGRVRVRKPDESKKRCL